MKRLVQAYGEFRRKLRTLLSHYDVISNPGWGDDEIINAVSELLHRYNRFKPLWQALDVTRHSFEDRQRILSGEITARICSGHREVRLGGPLILVSFDPSWTVMVDVVSFRRCIYATLTEEELRAAGFESQKEMMQRFSEIYHDFNLDLPATLIRFANPRGGLVDRIHQLAK